MGERECVDSTSSMVVSTSMDWFEGARDATGRVMVRTLAEGVAAVFSFVADIVAVFCFVLFGGLADVKGRWVSLGWL